MGDVSSVATEPFSSTGSPSTLKILPRVPLPTGTLIGAPVSTISIPLTKPSVPLMATARTWLSPSSCCTSQVTETSCPAGFFPCTFKAL